MLRHYSKRHQHSAAAAAVITDTKCMNLFVLRSLENKFNSQGDKSVDSGLIWHEVDWFACKLLCCIESYHSDWAQASKALRF